MDNENDMENLSALKLAHLDGQNYEHAQLQIIFKVKILIAEADASFVKPLNQ